MLNPFFLDKYDPGSWKALNGVALKGCQLRGGVMA
ncbi:hypothetical protein QF036_000490 [Arthrobacter globiformis]|nr:hypothetical protein [Arthrobacter globiformis]